VRGAVQPPDSISTATSLRAVWRASGSTGLRVRPASGDSVRHSDKLARGRLCDHGVGCARPRERVLLAATDVLSFQHEFLVDLFRERPRLALELLQACAGIVLEGAMVELRSIDLSQVVPTAYRSDAFTVVRDREGRAVAVVVVEVQLRTDEDKRRSWPVYVAAARASFGCPAMLLVLAPGPAVARWASQPIELGHPGFALRPIVIGYRQVRGSATQEKRRRRPSWRCYRCWLTRSSRR
jgi:hypothetical protein